MHLHLVSGRGIIMLPLHCAHAVLTVGWHGLWLGDMGQPKLTTEQGASWGPSEANMDRC